MTSIKISTDVLLSIVLKVIRLPDQNSLCACIIDGKILYTGQQAHSTHTGSLEQHWELDLALLDLCEIQSFVVNKQ